MDAFEAIADPTRREILAVLRGGECAAGELASRFEISRPAVSRHLRVLREAGLVTAREEAQRRLYRLEPAALVDVAAWVEEYRAFWGRRLDALTRRLEAGGEGEQRGP